MSTPTREQIDAALATVNDPEIKRPITELGMVDSVEIDDDGTVRVKVLLTVAGCPLKDTITRDVTAAVSAVDGVTGVDLELGVMTSEQRAGLQESLRGGQAQREIPFAQPGSLTKVFAIASGKGGVGKSSVTVNLALAMAKHGAQGRHRRRRHLRPLRPRDARRRRLPADPGRGPDHAGADVERRLGDLDRHAQAAPRPGRRLARADARPGPGPDARRRLLGRPRRPPPRPPAGHRRRRDLARPAPARCRGRRRHHAAGGCRRGGRAGRDDGLDDAPARRRRRREHELPRVPALRTRAPARGVRQRRWRPRRHDPLRRASATTYRSSAGSRWTVALREGGDVGKPIVEADPTAPSAASSCRPSPSASPDAAAAWPACSSA